MTERSAYQPASDSRAFHSLRAGITLIEMSIALVIIGLLVGAIVVGREMIESSTRRKQLSEWEQVTTLVNTFKLKYNALPGDIINANNFFAGSSNGTGDGKIATPSWGATDDFALWGNPRMERCQFWYHLSISGLITETYPVCTHGMLVIDHSPKLISSLTAGDGFNYAVTASCQLAACSTVAFTGDHYIITQAKYNGNSSMSLSAGNNHWQRPAPYTVSDMRQFDIKIDDGNALTGKLGVFLSTSPFPSAATTANLCTDAAISDGYRNGYTARECHLWFRLGF
jgi:prepilin-type N-terminal cleavage/methylation domain-containing protein